MTPMTLTESMSTRAFGILASRLNSVLSAVEREGVTAAEDDRRVLGQGVEFLDRLVGGSRLVEGYQFKEKGEITPGPESLRGVRQAFSTIRTLETLGQDQKISAQLSSYAAELRTILNSDADVPRSSPRVRELKAFFATLSQLFYEDLASQRLSDSAKPNSETRSRVANGVALAGVL